MTDEPNVEEIELERLSKQILSEFNADVRKVFSDAFRESYGQSLSEEDADILIAAHLEDGGKAHEERLAYYDNWRFWAPLLGMGLVGLALTPILWPVGKFLEWQERTSSVD